MEDISLCFIYPGGTFLRGLLELEEKVKVFQWLSCGSGEGDIPSPPQGSLRLSQQKSELELYLELHH